MDTHFFGSYIIALIGIQDRLCRPNRSRAAAKSFRIQALMQTVLA
jgi:hypothetical protein